MARRTGDTEVTMPDGTVQTGTQSLRGTAEVLRTANEAPVTVGSLPAIINLNLYQGDDFFLELQVGGAPSIDLTNYTPKAEIRQSPGSSSVLATFDTTIIDSVTIGLHLSADQSKLLTGNCSWDVQLTDAAGLVSTVARGEVNVTTEVTK